MPGTGVVWPRSAGTCPPRARPGREGTRAAAWKRAARALGAPDSARLPSSLPSPDAPWVGTCPRCGATRRLYRAPRRVSSCGVCSRAFDPALILTWEHHGKSASPGRAYERELAAIRRRR